MFSISSRSLFELISVAQMVNSNASAFIGQPSKLNRKDLQTALTELSEIVLTISGEAFEAAANEDKARAQAAIRQVLTEAQQAKTEAQPEA